MKLPADLFALLGIAPRFALEPAELDRRQRELFVERKPEGARTLEAINEAVRRLRDPATRAEQLFHLRGWPIKGSPDPVLLERIFTDREFIDQAHKKRDTHALEAWLEAAKPRHQVLLAELTLLLDGPGDGLPSPAEVVSGWEAPTAEGIGERALLKLEELRYFSRALGAAHAALYALEQASRDG